jgi:electron transport complex protein RnfD
MENLIVSSSPHVTDRQSTRGIMLDVITALIPATVVGIVIFGPRAALLTAVCIISAVLSEYICRRVMKRPQTVGDISAAVTGLLLALNLPVGLPLWMGALGSAVAIVVIKQMFGGIGQNFANPAIAARIVLLMSFGAAMTSWTAPFAWLSGTDAVTAATPLASDGTVPSYVDMLLGNRAGCIGETCPLALLLGGVYLCLRRVISPVIPVFFTGTTVLLMWAFGEDPLTQLMSGGLLLGAIFMATDYVTSPTTTKGRIVYAVGCGLITALIRGFGNLPEGVSFSILLMNILTPHIDNLMTTRPFGAVKEKKAGADK